MATGASHQFEDTISEISAANLNSLGQGGNVYADPVGGLKIAVTAIRGLINNVEIAYAGATGQSVTGGTTNYVYLDSSGTLQINTSGFPSYPSTKYFPLATVVTSSVAITSIVDRRWKFFA